MEIKISNFKLFNDVIGIFDEDNYFINLVKNISFNEKTISINGKKLTGFQKRRFLNKIKIIDKEIDDSLLSLNVYQYMRYDIIDNLLNLKDYKKKIYDSLSIVGLKSLNLNKKVIELSSCEKKLLQFATALLSNPDIIIFDCFFEVFDIKLRKKISNLLSQLVERYKKVVILCSNQGEFIYKYTNYSIVIKDGKRLIDGKTEDVFTNNVRLLIDNGFDVPEIIMFSYKANLIKNAKLNYHKDCRDLIKDIYKKV